ncbi:DUF3967 domain-containing protein (plasmid) [Bacillus sp. JAS24-2]|uniref:DUF3967 domain-containing protein n=1 Tax=Bacillus sp. JAS24-2 TaxID=2217832 RepID=UPI0011ED2E94|nr:DUF3967 domain-containing protein [Bacillus sp. JAS24-2]QEL82783.1 DUF3967 domain-containing protein [Bacillus sp. JAS24-2]
MNEERSNGSQDSLENAFWTKEVAGTLGISDSYLRKWCLGLEKNGYIFIKVKDGKNKENRAFTEHDIKALQKFKLLLQEPKMNLPAVAEVIAKEFGLEDRNGGMGNVPSPLFRDNDREKALNELKDIVIKEMQDNIKEQVKQELKEEMKEQLSATINEAEERLNKRIKDHDELLMRTIREQQETKKLLAAVKEEQQNKKWWKFWG